MGLDQYLTAHRAFPVRSQQAWAVLAAAKMTLAQLADTDEEGQGGIYLSDWRWQTDDDRDPARRVIVAADLDRIATEESGSGWLRYNPDDDTVEVQRVCVYWRKANAVHGWFVDNVQDGVDECQESRVINPEELARLLHMCQAALALYDEGKPLDAAHVMQPREGFFFGSYDVDAGWKWDMEHTVREIDRVLRAAVDLGPPICRFTYRSSW